MQTPQHTICARCHLKAVNLPSVGWVHLAAIAYLVPQLQSQPHACVPLALKG